MGRPSLNLTDEQKRARRIKKNKENMKIVKQDQIGVCQYITAEIQQFSYNSATNKYERTGSYTRLGLQYENNVIFDDGSYRNLNDSSVRAIQIYQGIPKGVSSYLQDLYVGYNFYGRRIIVKSGTKPYCDSWSQAKDINNGSYGDEV